MNEKVDIKRASLLAQTNSHSQDNQPSAPPQPNSSSGSRADSLDRLSQNPRLRIHQRRSKLRRETGPYSTSESLLLGAAGSSPTNRGDGKNGDDPRVCKVLCDAREGGRYELRLPDPSVSLSRGDADASAQGDQRANV
ncbi:hypothetical protein SLE2022_147650 [Rubroshorea leprosula]